MSDELLNSGEVIHDRWEVGFVLGQGGMGTAYLATDRRDGTRVAIKALNTATGQADARERFEREARVLSRFNHPNIVRVLWVGRHRDIPLIAMNYVDGVTLASWLAKHGGTLSLAETVALSRQLCAALTPLHAEGIVHRDLKPANILVDASGHLTLLDFGVARPHDSKLTRTGIIWGTAGYIAPEVIVGEKVITGRSDQYAVAVIVYLLLAGQKPFAEHTEEEQLLRAHLLAPRPDVRALVPSVPVAVSQVIQRGMSARPEDRFASVTAFQQALESAAATAKPEGAPSADVVATRASNAPILRPPQPRSGPAAFEVDEEGEEEQRTELARPTLSPEELRNPAAPPRVSPALTALPSRSSGPTQRPASAPSQPPSPPSVVVTGATVSRTDGAPRVTSPVDPRRQSAPVAGVDARRPGSMGEGVSAPAQSAPYDPGEASTRLDHGTLSVTGAAAYDPQASTHTGAEPYDPGAASTRLDHGTLNVTGAHDPAMRGAHGAPQVTATGTAPRDFSSRPIDPGAPQVTATGTAPHDSAASSRLTAASKPYDPGAASTRLDHGTLSPAEPDDAGEASTRLKVSTVPAADAARPPTLTQTEPAQRATVPDAPAASPRRPPPSFGVALGDDEAAPTTLRPNTPTAAARAAGLWRPGQVSRRKLALGLAGVALLCVLAIVFVPPGNDGPPPPTKLAKVIAPPPPREEAPLTASSLISERREVFTGADERAHQETVAPAQARPRVVKEKSIRYFGNGGDGELNLKVQVKGKPVPAEVKIDGRTVGQAPLFLPLTPGKHLIVITRRPFPQNVLPLEIKGGATTQLEVELQELPGLHD